MWGFLKWILIALAVFGITVILFSAPGGLLWNTSTDNMVDGPGMVKEPDYQGIKSVCWSYGGGELGGSHIYKLRRVAERGAELEVFTREEWGAPETTLTCIIDSAPLDDIEAIVSEHNLVDAQYNSGEDYVLDGDTWSLTIEYFDGSKIKLEEYQDFSDSEYDGIFAIRDILEALFEQEMF